MWNQVSAMETEAGGTAVDRALIRARSGDEAGFLVLWDALQPRLLRYLQVIGCDDVDDVASETWLQVIRDLPKFRKGGVDEFRAWLFTIGRHRAIDAARSRRRFRDKILAGEPAPSAVTPGNPVEDEVLQRLSTRQAVARILRKSPGAVRVALHRGLRTLSDDPRIHQIEEVDE